MTQHQITYSCLVRMAFAYLNNILQFWRTVLESSEIWQKKADLVVCSRDQKCWKLQEKPLSSKFSKPALVLVKFFL